MRENRNGMPGWINHAELLSPLRSREKPNEVRRGGFRWRRTPLSRYASLPPYFAGGILIGCDRSGMQVGIGQG
jgi:hypothetical protein